MCIFVAMCRVCSLQNLRVMGLPKALPAMQSITSHHEPIQPAKPESSLPILQVLFFNLSLICGKEDVLILQGWIPVRDSDHHGLGLK